MTRCPLHLATDIPVVVYAPQRCAAATVYNLRLSDPVSITKQTIAAEDNRFVELTIRHTLTLISSLIPMTNITQKIGTGNIMTYQSYHTHAIPCHTTD
jgi:hypothetical protein